MRPDEGLGRLVGLGGEVFDGHLETDDESEHAVLEPAAGGDGEEAIDGFRPRTRRRREVVSPARVTVEPRPRFLVLVGGLYVEDHVNVRWYRPPDWTFWRDNLNLRSVVIGTDQILAT